MVLGIRCTVTFTEQFWNRHRDVGLTVYPGKDHLPSEKYRMTTFNSLPAARFLKRVFMQRRSPLWLIVVLLVAVSFLPPASAQPTATPRWWTDAIETILKQAGTHTVRQENPLRSSVSIHARSFDGCRQREFIRLHAFAVAIELIG